jgi:hypothetical protein
MARLFCGPQQRATRLKCLRNNNIKTLWLVPRALNARRVSQDQTQVSLTGFTPARLQLHKQKLMGSDVPEQQLIGQPTAT